VACPEQVRLRATNQQVQAAERRARPNAKRAEIAVREAPKGKP
jgi:hypothetical protein